MPPYPIGGIGNQGGAICAIRMFVTPERLAITDKERYEHASGACDKSDPEGGRIFNYSGCNRVVGNPQHFTTRFQRSEQSESRANSRFSKRLTGCLHLRSVKLLSGSCSQVDLGATFAELFGLFSQSIRDGGVVTKSALRGVIADILGDAHAAELRSAHAAKVGDLRAFRRQRFIMIGAGRFGIERQVELVLPAELEPCLRYGVVPGLGGGMPLRE